MARLPRIVVPNVPHHVTQRGNRRQKTFFGDVDYEYYLKNLHELAGARGVEVVAYCLMPNHVHLILRPPDQKALTEVVGELHWRYTRYINFKKSWRGHLWQGRYFSVALSEEHFGNCIRYVEDNPLRAGLIQPGEKYKWQTQHDQSIGSEVGFSLIRAMTRTGRPKGNDRFLEHVEKCTGIDPRQKSPGPRKKVGG